MKKKDKLFLAATALIALAIPAAMQVSALQPKNYFIASGSMEPTLPVNSHIRIAPDAFQNIGQIRRGDIIVYSRPDKSTGKSMEVVNRVVGLPGDKVQLNGTKILLDGKSLAHVLVRKSGKIAVFRETIGNASYEVEYGDNSAPSPAFATTVSAGQLFCLGDNRDNSYDSRYTGAVPFASVIARRVP